VHSRDKDLRPAERFHIEVIEHFQFLAQLPEFEGPNIGEHSISYHSSNASVHAFYDPSSKSALTVVTRPIGDMTLRAELSCLYASAKLGPTQKIRRSARSSREVAMAIATQADALRIVLPLLGGPAGEELMRACHARY
jgi:hypothetical protein